MRNTEGPSPNNPYKTQTNVRKTCNILQEEPNLIRNRKRCQRRKTKKKYDPPKKREMKILQHNVAGLKTRMVETLKKAHRLKVDAMAIKECNFSVKRLPGDKIDHEIPKMNGPRDSPKEKRKPRGKGEERLEQTVRVKEE